MVRLAELMGAMSAAVDAGMGLPGEAGLRAATLAAGLARASGGDDALVRQSYYLSFLTFAGCTAESHLAMRVMGDEIAARQAMYGLDVGDARVFMGFLMRHAGHERAFPARVVEVVKSFTRAPALLDTPRAHCEVARHLAERFGLGELADALGHVFERWNGKGMPGKLRGEAIALAARIVHVAYDAEPGHRLGGVEQAVAVVKERAGKHLDPRLAASFAAHAAELCAPLEAASLWDAAMAAEPAPWRELDEERLDEALMTMGAFADMKSLTRSGHSAAVAELAAAAAQGLGLSAVEVTRVRRAGHLHDLGVVAVSNAVWDKRGPLSESERERVRLHAYQTERMLARPTWLAEIGDVAALAHERLDGGGYHRRLERAGLGEAARVLAAADVYAALVAPRPHRPALAPGAAADELRGEVKAGRLDGRAVEAVLAAAGHAAKRPAHGAGLSEREVEVLRLVARGMTNKEVASALALSPKTVGNHLSNIFEKLDVTTRAGATMVAMQLRLV